MNRLIGAVASILLVLGLAEGGAQFLEYIHPQAEDVRFDYAPYRMLKMTQAPFPLNGDGFRAARWEDYRGAFLVVFIGGSVCLGVGTDPGAPLPERLEEALHQAGLTKARVVNLCQGGTASAQELAILVQYGLPLQPHVVLAFNGANDLLHPQPLGEDDQPNLPYHDREMRALFAGHHPWTEHLALGRLSDRIGNRLKLGLSDPVRTPVPPSSILESYFYVTDLIRTLCESRGAAFGLILQPSLHYGKPLSDRELAQWMERRPRDGHEASDYARSLFVQERASAEEWSNRTGARLFDLTRTFEHTPETIYTDSVHFTGERGYRMLEQELERQGVLSWIKKRYVSWNSEPVTQGRVPETLTWRQ